jgi:hypothetical protein
LWLLVAEVGVPVKLAELIGGQIKRLLCIFLGGLGRGLLEGLEGEGRVVRLVGVEEGLLFAIVERGCFVGVVVLGNALVRWFVAEEGIILFCE